MIQAQLERVKLEIVLWISSARGSIFWGTNMRSNAQIVLVFGYAASGERICAQCPDSLSL